MNKCLKIMMLTTSFPRFQRDSAGVFIRSLCEQLIKKGHDITVLAPHSPEAHRNENWDGVKIYRFPYFYPHRYQRLCYGAGIMRNMEGSVLAKIQLPLLLLAEMFSSLMKRQEGNFDLIHAHWSFPQGFTALVLNWLTGIPCITTIHGSDVHGLRHPILRALNSKIINLSGACTANSRATAAMARVISGRDDIHVVPMGVDLELFTRMSGIDVFKEHRAGGDRIILFAGRFVDQKGIEYLVMALPRILESHPSTKLALVGSGPMKNKLVSLSHHLKIQNKVIFLGSVPQWQLARYYSSADVVVLPSITTDKGEREGLGLVLLEAMACGTPVIGTNHGGIPDIIKEEETGLLVNERDPDDLASNISRILAEEHLRRRLIDKGLAFVSKNFSWEIMAEKFLSLYQQVVDENNKQSQRKRFASVSRSG
jgi:glycosyltransferase involved in cell wall biosynthesis